MTIAHSILITHVSAAIIGLLSGALAMVFRKGSGLHGAAGSVFFVSMMIMSSTGAYGAAFIKPNKGNLMVAVLTFYLVATSWVTARRRQGKPGLFDRFALALILLNATAGLIWGVQAAASPRGVKDGMPAAMYFVFGTIALLCARADFRMFRSGGITGPRRIARHLARMGGAFFIALMSFYPGQRIEFPAWMTETKLLLLPHILVIGSLLYWVIRMRRARAVTRAHSVALQSPAAIHP